MLNIKGGCCEACADIHANTINKMTLPVFVYQDRCYNDIGTPVFCVSLTHITRNVSIPSNMITVITQEWFNVDRCYIPMLFPTQL